MCRRLPIPALLLASGPPRAPDGWICSPLTLLGCAGARSPALSGRARAAAVRSARRLAAAAGWGCWRPEAPPRGTEVGVGHESEREREREREVSCVSFPQDVAWGVGGGGRVRGEGS
jgi:hypothetical protein